MIHVVATIELGAGMRESFLDEFERLVPLVRREYGCLEYLPCVDRPTQIAAQPPVRPDAIMVLESWESLAALEAHMVAPHVVEFRAKTKYMVTGTKLEVFEPVWKDEG